MTIQDLIEEIKQEGYLSKVVRKYNLDYAKTRKELIANGFNLVKWRVAQKVNRYYAGEDIRALRIYCQRKRIPYSCRVTKDLSGLDV